MRIAMIAPQPYIEIRATPMENLRLTRILSNAGHTVDVITYPFGDAPDYPGVKVHRCRNAPFTSSIGIGFSLSKLILDIIMSKLAMNLVRNNKFDCIHGVEEGAFIGAFLSRRFGIPLVYDMDSEISNDIALSAVGKLPFVRKSVRAVERWAVRNSTVVITISEHMAKHVKELDSQKPVVIVPDIPLPIPAGGLNPDLAREYLPKDVSHTSKIIVYSGSFARYQGLDILIKAMKYVSKQFPSAVLLIVGGDHREIERIKQITNSDTIKYNLHFLGKKPPEQIPDLLNLADILVSPRCTGINPPAKIYTYMQADKPIVATDIPAHTSVLDGDSAVIVQADPLSLANGILWALDNSDEAYRRAEHAKELVSAITPQLRAERIKEAYEIVDRVRR